MSKRLITLAHGNGGRLMRELIEAVFARHWSGEDTFADAVAVPWQGRGELVVTCDGFTVKPLIFPGGDLGSLAVHGVVNDLAVAGADPVALTTSFIIEEGLPRATLEQLVASLARAAAACGVRVVAGDTKVVARGEGGGVYIGVTGLGERSPQQVCRIEEIQPGDGVVVSGPVGDHGAAVLLAREDFGLAGTLLSDCASVLPFTRAVRGLTGVRFMRDPTRGGLATVCLEISRHAGVGMRLWESAIPVRQTVQGVCEILGYDPLYLACEGQVVAVVAAGEVQEVLRRWRALPQGRESAVVGRVVAAGSRVVMETPYGGERFLEELEEDPLPRIC